MTPRSTRLCGLLALLLVAACDGGSDAKPKPKSSKAAASKAAPAKAGRKPTPAKTKAAPEVAKATPTPPSTVKADPVMPPADPAKTQIVDPATPTDPTTPTAADPTTPSAEAEPTTPSAEADPSATPTPDDPAAEGGSPPTATGAELSTPIPLGPDAELLRLVLAHGMEKRQPVDPATTFPEGQRVNLFIESRNEGEEPLSVRVTWENVKTGRRSPPTNVVIGTRKLHRTRAFRTMRKAGSFKAIVLGPDDQELAVLPFTVE